MIDLALSVLFTSLIYVVFKLFSVYKIETFYAITANYVVACITGLLFYGKPIILNEIPEKPWFLGSLFLGFFFIVIFNLIAQTSQKIGISAASIATKMSLVIPVLVGVFLYKEHLGGIQIIGILLALVAVYLASSKEKGASFNKKALLLPLMVFIGSGIIDASIKYLQNTYVSESEFPIFSALLFCAAAVAGIIIILIKAIKKPLKINLKNVLAGVFLGIPNYFSIYFLLRALKNPDLNSASIFTINNVAIVLLSTLLGILLFKEKLTTKNWGGITLAVASILLITLFNE
ncbi:MAG: DMT family transporter [Cellulophaga sp.]